MFIVEIKYCIQHHIYLQAQDLQVHCPPDLQVHLSKGEKKINNINNDKNQLSF